MFSLRKQTAGWILAACGFCLGVAAPSVAQPPVHYLHAGAMPPGAIGSQQLLRGGPIPGYFQPVQIRGPKGSQIATAEQGIFQQSTDLPRKYGMLIGPVYRFRITGIPRYEGLEVYPTLEVIDRIYPPLGLENKFPIDIELTQEELEMALEGKFVTRVIYLENPDAALPVAEDPKNQGYFEVASYENPLEVADRLGRPVAILRMGGRVPDAAGPDIKFLYGCPPLLRYTASPAEVVEPQAKSR
jgi:hypothetical protein